MLRLLLELLDLTCGHVLLRKLCWPHLTDFWLARHVLNIQYRVHPPCPMPLFQRPAVLSPLVVKPLWAMGRSYVLTEVG